MIYTASREWPGRKWIGFSNGQKGLARIAVRADLRQRAFEDGRRVSGPYDVVVRYDELGGRVIVVATAQTVPLDEQELREALARRREWEESP